MMTNNKNSNSSNDLVCLKIIATDEIRRFSVPTNLCFQEFSLIIKNINSCYSNYKLQYYDDENDLVTLTNGLEFEEVLRLAKQMLPKILRIEINKSLTQQKKQETVQVPQSIILNNMQSVKEEEIKEEEIKEDQNKKTKNKVSEKIDENEKEKQVVVEKIVNEEQFIENTIKKTKEQTTLKEEQEIKEVSQCTINPEKETKNEILSFEQKSIKNKKQDKKEVINQKKQVVEKEKNIIKDTNEEKIVKEEEEDEDEDEDEDEEEEEEEELEKHFKKSKILDRRPYVDEQFKLFEIGFMDVDRNKELLIKNKGNIRRVIDVLITEMMKN
ncbi:ovarian carcinoma antigen [Anaeramoeba flamelloides]|uniref:Ovarian carcinoma antigen n=1 Tax=Anaeramoeba flamelloides TaxID=1746091 RepID=A0ABQ8Y3L4_9EUKA|nr:ovarian carcinoma antigen [Anaeramoeba flamelloides]